MSELKVVAATLTLEIWVDCPNKCGNYIDLMRDYNEEGNLILQIFTTDGGREDFECDEVTCPDCETTFDVKVLDW